MSWRNSPLVYSDPDAYGMDASDVDDMAVRILLRKRGFRQMLDLIGPRNPTLSQPTANGHF